MPELLAVTDLIADVAIIFASIAVAAFAFSYATFFNWRLTQAGRSLMYFVLALLSVALLSFLGRWLGPEYFGREVLRPLTWGAVFVTACRLTWVLWTSRALNIESRSTSRSNAMTTDPLIPAAVKLAAKRAALKTAAQAARGAGAAVVAAIGASLIGVDWLIVGATAGASVITVVWAAIDAYLDKINNGIPSEYSDVTLAKVSVQEPRQTEINVDHAVARVLLRSDLKNKEA